MRVSRSDAHKCYCARVVNVNVYLPDEIGQRAKAADLPFSQLLRVAVIVELERRKAMSTTLEETQTYEVGLEDQEGRPYTGRVTGKRIAFDERRGVEVFLTEDE